MSAPTPNTIMRSYWVTKEYDTERGRMFFHRGVSETSMLEALLKNVRYPRERLDIEERTEAYWLARVRDGKSGNIVIHVHRQIERPEMGALFSVQDMRMESTKHEPRKAMPAKIEFKPPAQLELI